MTLSVSQFLLCSVDPLKVSALALQKYYHNSFRVTLLVNYDYWNSAFFGKCFYNFSRHRDSEINCNRTLLHTIQMLEVLNDSKTFVDMKIKNFP
eukprot:XP_016656230.1 PREDICTED: uncharacterized protein LOC107882423 [Acyrthosiphon pisum]